MIKKLIKIQEGLNHKLFEREKEIEGILLALLSRQHVLLIGEPGTGKSKLSMELSKLIDGSKYFQWLLTRFTTPEEIFGALNLKEFENGIHVRNTKDKLPEAHFGFLDEVFKANSAILNSLLTLINERLFYNNGTPTQSPLMTVIGASNEFPEEDENLEALYDRFLLRYEVEQVKEDTNFISVLKGKGNNVEIPSMTLNELTELQFFCELISINENVFEAIRDIRKELSDEGIHPSVRRFEKSVRLLQARAMLQERQQVELQDLIILEHILWDDVDEKEMVSSIVKSYAQDRIEQQLEHVEIETKEIIAQIKKDASTDMSLEANEKLKRLIGELTQLQKENPNREDISSAIVNIKNKQQEIVNNVLEPMNV